jgi:2-polyprenyl-3-methyl-5-hydroxy-6-metoxy-1,4-benzoquinol methylase
MKGIEKVYREHHEGRGRGFAILQKERGAFLKRHIGTGKRVLDIGCRDGQLTSTYYEGNDVTGVDIDEDALNRAKANFGIKIVHHDLNDDWPFEAGSFDVVVACEFLEHIYFPANVAQKVNRILKEDGVFIGTIPHAFSLQSRIKLLFGIKKGTPLQDPTHINHFTVNEFQKILKANFSQVHLEGLTPKRYSILANFFPFLFAHLILFVARR